MFKNEYTLNVDLKSRQSAITPVFVQYDSAVLVFKIFDGGKPYDLSEFTRAEVSHRLSDSTTIVGNASIEKDLNNRDVVKYIYQGSEMNKLGFIETSLSVFSGNKKVSIQPFRVNIVTDLRDGALEESMPEYGLLQEMTAQLETITTNTQTAITGANIARDDAKKVADNTAYIADYSTLTNYKKNNIVTFNGSSYIAKQDTVGNPPPTLPATTNVYWGLAGRKGTDGTGTVVRHRDEFIATANQKTFALTNPYDQFQNRINVTVGGVPQFSPDNFEETSSKSITFSDGVPQGVKVIVEYFSEAVPMASDVQTTVNNHTGSLSVHAQRLAQAESTIITTTQSLADKAKKSDVTNLTTNKADKAEVNSLASAKADKTYVDTNLSTLDTKINSQASGSPKGTYATLALLQTAFPTGNANIYVVTADGKWYYWNGLGSWTAGGLYQSTGIADKAITEGKTSFIKISSNIYDKSSVTLGKNISSATGVISDNATTGISDFINIKPNTPYTTNRANSEAGRTYYNESMGYISGTAIGGAHTSPSNAVYMRLSMPKGVIDSTQLNEGATLLSYEPHYKELDTRLIKEEGIDGNKLKKGSIDKDRTTFLKKSSNLFDVSTQTVGHQLWSTTGVSTANAQYSHSDFIDVEPSQQYSMVGIIRIVFYGLDKQFLSYSDAPANNEYTATMPSNCYLMRVHYGASDRKDIRRINKGSVLLPYEKFGYTLDSTIMINRDSLDTPETPAIPPEEVKYIFPPAEIGSNLILGDGIYSTFTLEELYAAFEVLIAANPDYFTKTLYGKDTTGTYDVFKYRLKPKEYDGSVAGAFGGNNELGNKLPKITFIANIHGFEKPSALATYYMVKAICENWRESETLEYLRWNVEFVFIPVAHPWGYVNGVYSNSTGVNIQTNFPANWILRDPTSNVYGGTEPLSEIETTYIKRLIDENTDSVFFADLHTAGFEKDFFEGVDNLFYFLVPTGKHYNQDIEIAAKYAIESNTRLLKKHYPITSNNLLGWIQRREGLGTADAYANSLGIPSIVMELFYRTPYDATQYTNDSIKASTEVLINNLLTILRRFKDVQ